VKKVRNILSCWLLVLCITSCASVEISFDENIYFEEFYEYKDILEEIAYLALDLYRTNSQDEKFFIDFQGDNICGYGDEIEGQIEIDIDLIHAIEKLKKSEIPCTLTYLIVGDTYVTFTREGTYFAIMYSEDDVRPTGAWKYNRDDVEIAKYEECWYELFVSGLGLHP